MKEAETNLDEDELLPRLTPEIQEKLLVQIRERREKAKRLYDDAMALKEVDSLKAIALFYQLYELMYRRELYLEFQQELIECEQAARSLFESQIPESEAYETISLQELSPQESFYRGLQALSGIGKKCRNNKTALQYFEFAAEKGEVSAQYLLGQLFLGNKCGIPTNLPEAKKWFALAAEQNDPDALLCVGRMIPYIPERAHDTTWSQAIYSFVKGRKYVPAPEQELCYKKSAEQGYPRGEYEFAGIRGFWNRYNPSSYVVTPARRESLKWLYLSAIHGYPEALWTVGEHFDEGIGVKKNENEAMKWYQLAAEQGFLAAQQTLWERFSHYGPEPTQVKVNFSVALKEFGASYQQSLANCHTGKDKEKLGYQVEFFRSKLRNFSDRYYLERTVNNKEQLQGLCRFNPHHFFEALYNDKSLSASELDDWLVYLITHHFEEMKLEVQLSIAQKICASDHISPSVAFPLIKFLQFFPEIREEYTKVLEILEKLHGVTDKNGYLARYYARMHHEKTSAEKLIEEADEENIWIEAAVRYCQAEIVKSPEEFKSWLEKEIKELESLEKTSVAELNLLHEFYYRLAKIKCEEALALKLAQNSFVSKVTSWLFWSTPEPIQIIPTIEFLKNIPPLHRRFEDAQILLQKCQEDFKDVLQEDPESLIVGIKLGRGKQD